jgi:hypothetical protein
MHLDQEAGNEQAGAADSLSQGCNLLASFSSILKGGDRL